MSATNRGAERAQDDYYATPDWVSDGLLSKLSLDGDRWFIDCGCGDGAILGRAIANGVAPGYCIGIEIDGGRAGIARQRYTESAILDGDFLTNKADDYLARLSYEPTTKAGSYLIVGNPPYSLAIEFAKRALELAAKRPGSVVALLLRLGFLETPKRAAFHVEHPSHLYVLPKRPSFCHSFTCKPCSKGRDKPLRRNMPTTVSKLECPECGKNMSKTTSDATGYAWFVWGDGKPNTWEPMT